MSDSHMEVIDTYTRAEAIDDGTLIDVSKHAAGYFKFPVAVTQNVWSTIQQAVNNKKHCNDLEGVLHDVFYMAQLASKTSEGDMIKFTVIITGAGRKKYHNLWAICGPGDNAEPVITIMYPEDY